MSDVTLVTEFSRPNQRKFLVNEVTDILKTPQVLFRTIWSV